MNNVWCRFAGNEKAHDLIGLFTFKLLQYVKHDRKRFRHEFNGMDYMSFDQRLSKTFDLHKAHVAVITKLIVSGYYYCVDEPLNT